MKMTVQNCIVGSIGGVGIYIIATFCSMLPYMSIADGSFDFLFKMCIVLGTVTVVSVLLYKKPVPAQMLLRFVFQFLSYSCLLVLNGYIGTIQIVYKWLSFKDSSGNDNISGMLTLTFVLIIETVAVLVIIASKIIEMRQKRHKTGNGGQGDGSVS